MDSAAERHDGPDEGRTLEVLPMIGNNPIGSISEQSGDYSMAASRYRLGWKHVAFALATALLCGLSPPARADGQDRPVDVRVTSQGVKRGVAEYWYFLEIKNHGDRPFGGH